MSRAPIKQLPTKAELDRLFKYDPTLGTLTWKSNPKFNGASGHPVGTVSFRGYRIVGIGRRYYTAQRLIWKMMTGCDPVGFVDHINGDRLDNRWVNLRPASNGENIANSKIRRDNKSGVKGVCWDTSHSSWRVQISVNGKNRKLGRFKRLEDAKAVAISARHNLHKEFARFS